MRITKPLAQEILKAYEALYTAVEGGDCQSKMADLRTQYRNIRSMVQENEEEQERLSAFRQSAIENHVEEGAIEVDENAVVSAGEDSAGAYVEAWIWVSLSN